MKKMTEIVGDDARAASFVSRSFQDQVGVYTSLENDLKGKIKSVIGNDSEFEVTKISEMNPYHITSLQDIESRKDDSDFVKYLSTWDDETLCKVTCTTESLTFDADGDLVSLPKEFVFKYYVKSFDDSMMSKNVSIENLSSSIN